jgi:hypothetical protein
LENLDRRCRDREQPRDARVKAGMKPATARKERVMRFMAMLKFDESLPGGPPPPELFQAMGEYAAEGARNGTLVDQGGLLPSAAGAIVSLVDGTIKAVDGPFTEAKELVGGYAVLEVRSKAEAVELAKRLMQIHKDHWPGWQGSCEVRQLGES